MTTDAQPVPVIPTLTKSVSFSLNPPPPSTPPPPTTTPTKRRVSALKESSLRTSILPGSYQHSDPLLRRLRLQNYKGERVNLQQTFDGINVIGFMFGAWSGSSNIESYSIVERFSERFHDRVKIIYVSIDPTEQEFLSSTSQRKHWLACDFRDGSSASNDRDDLSLPSPLEPFLLATDVDLEADLHLSDPAGLLYLRPFSRVYLAEKFGVFSVPQLVVYSHGSHGKVITKSARFGTLKGEKAVATLEKWERGESVDFGIADLAFALRWTFAAGVLALSYVAAVKFGGDDALNSLSKSFISEYFGK